MAKHMDRLSSVDASFLAQEREGSHMHIGSILLFEGPAPAADEVIAHVESRLHLVPRYRQKLSFPRLEMGRPLWVDDPSFNVGYHVRQTALPAPGSVEQLRLLAGRIFSQRLDRSKPLWELWLVEGLEDGRFAVINKTHHCLVDGVSGADLTAVMFDLERDGTRVPAPEEPWQPAPEPNEVGVAARGVADLAGAPVGLVRRAASALGSPGRAVAQAREAAAGVGEVAWNAVVSAPETPLNGPMGPHRRLSWVRMPLAELKQVKNELGGTVNDVFLTVISGALHRWLRSRGVVTEGLELRSAVPVSIRMSGTEADLGNQITIMIGRLPTYVEDPVERHRLVVESMADLKESKQAMGAELIAGLEDFAPPTVFAQASRLHFSTRMYNLLTTNVPGPQIPLYMLGREMTELVPVAFLAPGQRLAVAMMSYNGTAALSLIGDYDTMPDLERLMEYAQDELSALGEAARDPSLAGAR
ncbi:MAG TPA: wax ester/triacylglycerol synthase family O-acyltransferase [Thermoleophilaceae bacterium]|nr:wax ester/triacylglycerol synthase family O-acyltransferase [Thermoleophilaceae bacterium]